ncbi:MAG: START domain-containing protein [Chitinophagales bacterium]|nr:START domain-containing protein [Chitinophagales bacterium]
MRLIGLLLGLSMFFPYLMSAQNTWTLEKDKDGIQIFNRKMDGTKLKEYKGVMKIKASVDDVVKVLTNYKMHDRFIYKAKQGSVELLKKNRNEFYTYMIISTPWPAANRDIVTRYYLKPKSKDGSVIIEVSSVEGMKPVQSKIVRVEDMKGYWKIQDLSNGYVEVTHQAYSKPGGSVPEGMANSASVSAPFDMLNDLRKILE